MDIPEVGRYVFSWLDFMENPREIEARVDNIFQSTATLIQDTQEYISSWFKTPSLSATLHNLLAEGSFPMSLQEARSWDLRIGLALLPKGISLQKYASFPEHQRAFAQGMRLIIQKLQEKLPVVLSLEVENLFAIADFDTLPEDLLLYAEGLRRSSKISLAVECQKAAEECALFPEIFDLVQESFFSSDPRKLAQQTLSRSLQKLSHLQACMDEMKTKDLSIKPAIDPTVISKIISAVLPADKKKDYKKYERILLSQIQNNLELASQTLTTSVFVKHRNLPFALGIRVQNTPGKEGVHIICFSENELPEETDALKEYCGFQVFFPKFPLPGKPVEVQEVRIGCAKEEKNAEVHFLSCRSFCEEPSFVIFQKYPLVFSRGPYRVPVEGFSLRENLKICASLLSRLLVFHRQGWTYPKIQSWALKSKKDLEGNPGCFWDPTNSFLQEKEAPIEDGSFLDPVSLFNELTHFFFSQRWDQIELQERMWTHNLQKKLSFKHREFIFALKEKHGGFHEGFIQELLIYMHSISMEEQDQRDFLKSIAEQMSVFPLFYDLFQKHSQGRPISFSEFKKVLEKSEDLLLHMEDFLFTPCKISIEQAETVVDTMLTNDVTRQEKKRYAELLQKKLTKCFQGVFWQERHYKRLSKQKTGLPFSLWAIATPDALRLTVWDSCFNFWGADKKVKGAYTFFLPQKGDFEPLSFFSSVLYRKKTEKDFSEGLKIHKEINTIPGSEKYFMPYPVFFPTYQGLVKEKKESENIWYNGDLFTAGYDLSLPLDRKKMQSKPVFPSDLLQCLHNTLEGIQFLARHNFCHGDIKLENIALKLKNGKWISHIFDFDFAKKANTINGSIKCDYVNSISRVFEFVSSETDLYGLVYILAELFLFPTQRAKLYNEDLQGEFDVNAIKEEYFKKIIDTEVQHNHPWKIFLLETKGKGIESMQTVLWKLATEENTKDNLYARASDIRRTIIGLSFLEDLLPLCKKMVNADRSSLRYMQSHLKEETDVALLARKALDQAHFPSMEEIGNVLKICEKKALWIEKRLQRSSS